MLTWILDNKNNLKEKDTNLDLFLWKLTYIILSSQENGQFHTPTIFAKSCPVLNERTKTKVGTGKYIL
jgi:hypothetical protein